MKATVIPLFIDKMAEGCNGDVTLEMNSNDGACARFNLDQETVERCRKSAGDVGCIGLSHQLA